MRTFDEIVEQATAQQVRLRVNANVLSRVTESSVDGFVPRTNPCTDNTGFGTREEGRPSHSGYGHMGTGNPGKALRDIATATDSTSLVRAVAPQMR